MTYFMNPSFFMFILEMSLVHTLSLLRMPIVKSNCVKDPGVHLSSSLKSLTHCSFTATCILRITGITKKPNLYMRLRLGDG